jgi:hypothetical protein
VGSSFQVGVIISVINLNDSRKYCRQSQGQLIETKKIPKNLQEWENDLYSQSSKINLVGYFLITAIASLEVYKRTKFLSTKLIAGEHFIQNQDLTSYLQNYYDITLIERSLSFGEDLILDERTCVVIFPVKLFKDEQQTKGILNHILKLSLRYQKCFCILEQHTESER